MMYNDVTEQLATVLKVDDPLKIRLTGHNTYYDQPKMSPIKRAERMTLMEMLISYYSSMTDILYYEILDVSILDLENKRVLEVVWYNSQVKPTNTHKLLLDIEADVSAIIEKVAELEKTGPTAQLRVMEIWNYKVHKVLKSDEKLSRINKYSKLRVEEITEDELQSDQTKIHCVHYTPDPPTVHNFGEPFFLAVPKDETLEFVKHKIKEKLGIEEQEFEKWKFALVSYGRPTYLPEDTVISRIKFQGLDYLGLEHKDTTVRRRRREEKGIVLKN